MEDVQMVRRLRRKGRIAILPESVNTSGRRWLTMGVWRATLVNTLCQIAYSLGVSPQRIHDWYYGKREYTRPGQG